MPERDVIIDEDNLPNIQTEDRQSAKKAGSRAGSENGGNAENNAYDQAQQDEVVSSSAYTSTAHKSLVQTAIWPAISLLILLLCGLSLWNKMLVDDIHQQDIQLQDAQLRLTKLEAQLSTTDESVSQSSVAMQIKLKELSDRNDELWTQMDKLWASAWRRNQTEIVAHSKQLDENVELLKTIDAKLSKLSQRNNGFKADIMSLNAKTEDIAAIDKSLTKNTQQLKSFSQQIDKISKQIKANEKIANENTKWLESVDVFRQQTNRKFSDIQKEKKSTGL